MRKAVIFLLQRLLQRVAAPVSFSIQLKTIKLERGVRIVAFLFPGMAQPGFSKSGPAGTCGKWQAVRGLTIA